MREGVLVSVVLLVLAGVGYGFLLERDAVLYSPHSDNVSANLGRKEVLYRSWQDGEGIPFWQGSQMAGGPALTNPQALYTYPFHVLFYLLPPTEALGPTVWLHFLLAGAVLYLFGRGLGLRREACLLTAVAGLFSFKLQIAAYAGWLPVLPSIVFSPLLALSVVLLARRRTLGSGLLFAAVAALCLHAGHVQLVYYTTLYLTCYLLVQAAAWWRRGERGRVGRVAALVLGGSLLAAGTTAYLLLPMAAEAELVSRSRATWELFLADHALSPRHLWTFLFPEALGTPLDGSYPGSELWEDVAYFGIVPLGLAVAGGVLGRRRPEARALVAALVLSVLFAMDTFLSRLAFEVVPGFDLFRCPSRLLFLASFAGIALAGVGLDEILRRAGRSAPGASRRRVVVTGLLCLVIAVEGGFYARRYLSTVPAEAAFPRTDWQAALARDDSAFRVAPFGRSTMNYGWAAGMGLELVTGYDAYNLRHYQTYFDLVRVGEPGPDVPRAWADLRSIRRLDLLHALDVEYVLTTAPVRFPEGWFELVERWEAQPTFVLYRGLQRVPVLLYRSVRGAARASWAEEVVAVGSEADELAAMQDERLEGVAVVRERRAVPLSSPSSPGDRVEVLEAGNGTLVLELANAARRYLVIGEVWHPGWRATLDGEPLPLVRTNHALLGAWIPPGTHRLALSFRPLLWTTGLSVSVLSGVVLLALVGICAWRRRAARDGGDRYSAESGDGARLP